MKLMNAPPPVGTINGRIVKRFPSYSFPHGGPVGGSSYGGIHFLKYVGSDVCRVSCGKGCQLSCIICSPTNPDKIICSSNPGLRHKQLAGVDSHHMLRYVIRVWILSFHGWSDNVFERIVNLEGGLYCRRILRISQVN